MYCCSHYALTVSNMRRGNITKDYLCKVQVLWWMLKVWISENRREYYDWSTVMGSTLALCLLVHTSVSDNITAKCFINLPTVYGIVYNLKAMLCWPVRVIKLDPLPYETIAYGFLCFVLFLSIFTQILGELPSYYSHYSVRWITLILFTLQCEVRICQTFLLSVILSLFTLQCEVRI